MDQLKSYSVKPIEILIVSGFALVILIFGIPLLIWIKFRICADQIKNRLSEMREDRRSDNNQ